MKTFIRLAAFGIGVGILALATVPSVNAQTANAEKPVKYADLCKIIKNRLTIRVGNVNQARDENIAVYEGLNKRFEKVIAGAEKKEYDVTTMKTALEETRTMIASYEKSGKDYSNQLVATSNDACIAETNYKTAVDAARVNIKTAREAGLSLRNSFQYSVIPELRAYKVWLNEQATAATTESTTETPVAPEEAL